MTTHSSPTYLQRSLADLKNYAGLIGALLAMCVLFSFASENFFTLATLSTLSNDTSGPGGDGRRHDLRADHRRH